EGGAGGGEGREGGRGGGGGGGREARRRSPAAEQREVRATRGARGALVGNCPLPEADPGDEPAHVELPLGKLEQPVERAAREQLEVTRLDRQLDLRGELDQPVGDARDETLARRLAAPGRAPREDDLG